MFCFLSQLTSGLIVVPAACRKTWQLQFTYTASQPGTHQKIIDMAMNGVGCRASARIMGVGLNTVLRHLKNSGRSR
ncbi:IS1-like element transposase [Klebsiella pneumoniae]|uniref:IS1-like element transposase n=1 Tax=Klebsiella pneumoniae TaxID=573 RepID=UPI0035B5134F